MFTSRKVVTASFLLALAAGMIWSEIPRTNAQAPADAWTSTGSTGTVDEDSAGIVFLNNFTVGFNPAAGSATTGTVTSRYNVTAVGGVARFCPATASDVVVRYRDSDGAGTGSSVVVELRTSNLATGGNTLLFSFDSNTGTPSGTGFATVTTPTLIDFDFSTNIYWIEAKISRSSDTLLANLGPMQIYETAGTPCP